MITKLGGTSADFWRCGERFGRVEHAPDRLGSVLGRDRVELVLAHELVEVTEEVDDVVIGDIDRTA
jgi:hypothetical protein